MSTQRNARNVHIPKTWEKSCEIGKEKALDRAPKPQTAYKDIMVFPYGYTDPPDPSHSKHQRPLNPKRSMAKTLPIWAPGDYKRLHLYNDFLPINATKAQWQNLFQQIHDHFGRIGAHTFETSGLQGILPTTRWPLPLATKVDDTYYIIRMRDNRKKEVRKEERKEDKKEGAHFKAFLEFLVEHKNNYCAAWRVIKKKSEFETAKWCCFSDFSYLNEQEPFKGKVVITNYISGYTPELNEVKMWEGMFGELFDFLYRLYAKPKSNTTPFGKRLFQTFFVAMFEGKRFPEIERFTAANVKNQLVLEYAPVLPTPLYNAVHVWSSLSDLIFLLVIVLIEDELAKILIALRPDANDLKKPHKSLIPLFEQFRRHRTKAELRCDEFASDVKGLHVILQLQKDKASDGQETESYGLAAYERLTECLNLLMFNRDHVLAVKARESGFQGLLGVNLSSLKNVPGKPVEEQSTASSSGAAGRVEKKANSASWASSEFSSSSTHSRG